MLFSKQNARVKTVWSKTAITLHTRWELTWGKEGGKQKRKSEEKWSSGNKELNLGSKCSPWKWLCGRLKRVKAEEISFADRWRQQGWLLASWRVFWLDQFFVHRSSQLGSFQSFILSDGKQTAEGGICSTCLAPFIFPNKKMDFFLKLCS